MMKKSKLLLATLPLALTTMLMGNTALAGKDGGGYCTQKGKGHHGGKHQFRHDPEKKLSRMTRKLGLDENQQNQIRNVLTAGQETMQGLHDQMQANREQLRTEMANGFDEAKITELANAQGDLKAKMIVERARMRSGIHAYLTEEQQEKIRRKGHHRQ